MGPDLAQRFDQLSAFLGQHRALWSERALVSERLSWESTQPGLSRALRCLPLATISSFESQPDGLASLLPPVYAELARAAAGLEALPAVSAVAPEGFSGERRERSVPGRKWQQIEAFAATLQIAAGLGSGDWVDWCGGKGHLGRSLAAFTDSPVRVLERDPQLCLQARTLGARLKVRTEAVACDVLDSEVRGWLRAGQRGVALHACGALGLAFLREGCRAGLAQLALAPCCYHRIEGERYPGFSRRAQGAPLGLDRGLLRLPTTEQRRPSSKALAARHRRIVWRVAFARLVGEVLGTKSFVPVSYYPHGLLRLSFGDFAAALAARNGLALPQGWDEAALLSWADDRARVIRGLSLLRWLFRRPMELWLALDRALYLEERGYRAQVWRFCATAITPRNLLVHGVAPRS